MQHHHAHDSGDADAGAAASGALAGAVTDAHGGGPGPSCALSDCPAIAGCPLTRCAHERGYAPGGCRGCLGCIASVVVIVLLVMLGIRIIDYYRQAAPARNHPAAPAPRPYRPPPKTIII